MSRHKKAWFEWIGKWEMREKKTNKTNENNVSGTLRTPVTKKSGEIWRGQEGIWKSFFNIGNIHYTEG